MVREGRPFPGINQKKGPVTPLKGLIDPNRDIPLREGPPPAAIPGLTLADYPHRRAIGAH